LGEVARAKPSKKPEEEGEDGKGKPLAKSQNQEQTSEKLEHAMKSKITFRWTPLYEGSVRKKERGLPGEKLTVTWKALMCTKDGISGKNVLK